MQAPARIILATLVVSLCAGCSGMSRVDVWRVVTSGRDGWQHPDRVIDALAIEPGSRVAEIGAGDGYWVEWLSEAVGPTGIVYLVEVEPDLVAKLRDRVADAGFENVTIVLGDYDDPKLPDGEIDLAMTCLTYHHIDSRSDYFRRLGVDLSEGGRVAHLDDRPDAGPPISWFQSDGHWSDPAAVVAEMNAAGYQPVARFDFLPAQSFQIFERTAPPHQTAQRP